MTTRLARVGVLTLAASAWLGATALRATTPRPLDDVTAPPPARLSATGLYADAATLTVDPRNRPFAPQYPLWSDGATKRRWVRLPDGAVIDARDPDAWNFPVGTRFWKEFALGGRRVETRMFWKVTPDHWEFAAYAWRDDQRDATLVPADGLADVAEVAPGKWHSIPSQAECRACHDATRTEALGFTALQLSDDRDPLAPHAEPLTATMVTTRSLAATGLLGGLSDGPAGAPRVEGRTPVERAALGYLSTNCGSCHNRQSTIASLGLSLKYSLRQPDRCAPDAIATTLDHPGHWLVPDAPEGTSRVVAPGAPGRSAVYRRAASRRPSSQMPPIGSVLPDRLALGLIESWIAGLPTSDRGSCSGPSVVK